MSTLLGLEGFTYSFLLEPYIQEEKALTSVAGAGTGVGAAPGRGRAWRAAASSASSARSTAAKVCVGPPRCVRSRAATQCRAASCTAHHAVKPRLLPSLRRSHSACSFEVSRR